VSAHVTLGLPGDLAGFPATRAPARIHRVCQAIHGTWWFCSDGSGRFDLAAPEGTCYFATDGWAAIREASRLGPVTPHWVLARDLREVSVPRRYRRLAAATWKAAGRYGVTAELGTLVPYDLPQRWAAAFRAHGFQGMRHMLRHDPRSRATGVSLFDTEGPAPNPDGLRTTLEVAVVRAAGVAVHERPHSTVLRIVP
jgi:hypothetical protein